MKQGNIRGKRILLVDDEPGIRGAFSLMLSLDDHIVTEANNGVEALSLFEPGRFDLIITDLDMPVMQGNQLAVRVKKAAPRQPILMITAYAERVGVENPVDVILSKPFTLEDLRQAIEKALASTPDPVTAMPQPPVS